MEDISILFNTLSKPDKEGVKMQNIAILASESRCKVPQWNSSKSNLVVYYKKMHDQTQFIPGMQGGIIRIISSNLQDMKLGLIKVKWLTWAKLRTWLWYTWLQSHSLPLRKRQVEVETGLNPPPPHSSIHPIFRHAPPRSWSGKVSSNPRQVLVSFVFQFSTSFPSELHSLWPLSLYSCPPSLSPHQFGGDKSATYWPPFMYLIGAGNPGKEARMHLDAILGWELLLVAGSHLLQWGTQLLSVEEEN